MILDNKTTLFQTKNFNDDYFTSKDIRANTIFPESPFVKKATFPIPTIPIDIRDNQPIKNPTPIFYPKLEPVYGYDVNPVLVADPINPKLTSCEANWLKLDETQKKYTTKEDFISNCMLGGNSGTNPTGATTIIVEPNLGTLITNKPTPSFGLDNPQGGGITDYGDAVVEVNDVPTTSGGTPSSDLLEDDVAMPIKNKKFPYWIIIATLVGAYLISRKK